MRWDLILAFVLVQATGVLIACDGNLGTPEPTPKETKPVQTTRTTPAPTAVSTQIGRPPLILLEFPNWIEESPHHAAAIAASNVIVIANLVSIESAVAALHVNFGYEAELTYRFEVIEYLKGDGQEELAVTIGSGPFYQGFPDVIGHRTEEEARELGERWKKQSLNRWANIEHGILFVEQSLTGRHSFASTEWSLPPHPAIGETWLWENIDGTYGAYGVEPVSIETLAARIEDMRQLRDGQYMHCVDRTLHKMIEVRDRIEGTYRELTLGGWIEPEPLRRRIVELSAKDLAHPRYYDTTLVSRSDRFPPITSVFGHYWLDGKDKDLFAIDIYELDDTGDITERLLFVGGPNVGEYTVHFSQYHKTIPCDSGPPWNPANWWHWDAVEWVVRVQ